MLVLLTYDVCTETASGKRRLRKVAKECVNYGQRVQKSVFECQLDAAQFRMLKGMLEEIIDPNEDSIRYYNLGKNYSSKVMTSGVNQSYKADTDYLSI